jgi:hypothetical protein
MTMKRRLERLEGFWGKVGPTINIVRISLVDPSPAGPVSLGPYSAHILTGPNAGAEVRRANDESAEAFDERCNRLLKVKPCH